MNGRASAIHGAYGAVLIVISCAGRLAAAAEDIRDIRGPKFIPPPWLIPALLAAAVLLAWGAYRAWRWLRRRQRPRAPLPFEVALQRLEDIRALMQPPTAREFSTAVSDVVRSYIEQRFDVIATHQTTEEFLHDLLESSDASLVRHRTLLSEFLHQCDLVKFAGMSLTLQSMESLHQSARAFVLETAKPVEAETRAAIELRAAPQPSATPQPTATEEAHDSLPST
jgi:HAMP domain-containing protein